jgi:hypothetical protein
MSDMQRVELTPISAADLAERVGNPRRAKLYESLAMGVFDSIGLANFEGVIRSKAIKKTLEKEVARLLSSDGLVTYVDPEIVYAQPEYAYLVKDTVARVASCSKLEDRTAWVHSALVQGRRLYDEREQAREAQYRAEGTYVNNEAEASRS